VRCHANGLAGESGRCWLASTRTAGGGGGLRRVLEVLGPSIESWWRDLGRVRLTPEIIEKVVASTDQMIERESVEALDLRRDATVASILRVTGD
jgi:carnitine 3-dehydrogenase